jgi:hypothetical protein
MELQNPFEMLFAETLDAGGRSPRTQKSYVWMLRLLGRFVAKPLDQVTPEDIQAYQRHLTNERKVGFSTFNQKSNSGRRSSSFTWLLPLLIELPLTRGRRSDADQPYGLAPIGMRDYKDTPRQGRTDSQKRCSSRE